MYIESLTHRLIERLFSIYLFVLLRSRNIGKLHGHLNLKSTLSQSDQPVNCYKSQSGGSDCKICITLQNVTNILAFDYQLL